MGSRWEALPAGSTPFTIPICGSLPLQVPVFQKLLSFLKVFQGEILEPTWYEKKLWHLYDSTDYALNLFNCPTVAYSGERDRQKQAAEMMTRALEIEGIELSPHQRRQGWSQLHARSQGRDQPPNRHDRE